MKTYCVKCRKDTENIDQKIEQKIIELVKQLKNQELSKNKMQKVYSVI